MRTLTLSLASILALLALPRSASAEFPAKALYVGAYGGATIALRDWDLGDTEGKITPSSTGMLGFRVGFQLLSRLALEGELALLPMKSSTDDLNTVLDYNLDLIFHLLAHNWTPTLGLGIGGYHSVSGDLGGDFDPRIHFGLGVRGLVLPWMALRLDLRDVVTDGFDKWGANNLELSLGVDFFVWEAKDAPDRDKDGVPDATDECPDAAGGAPTRGCPDADRDGTADRDDRCPADSGPAKTKGCPDADGDGVPDADDKCPKQPGPEKTSGCPDRDGDGVLDIEDKCPDHAGPVKAQGCPDKDGDGVADAVDRCPKEAGAVELKGCPDKDGDRIPDIEDQCPDVAGIREKAGCMPDVKKFSGAIKGINFAVNSSKILPVSFKLLDQAVAALKEYPSLRLSIAGHTDNLGKPEKNQTLSQARAEAVRDYLVQKGIDAARIDATGFGDTQPVKDNKTAAGRAANRRIEFKVSAQ